MKTITFDTPVIFSGLFGSYPIKEIKVRPPVIKDLYGISFTPENATQTMVILASRLTKWKVAQLESLPLHEFSKVSLAISDYMNGNSK